MTEYYYAIDWMRTHRKGEPVAKDKPLLLLLAISKVMQIVACIGLRWKTPMTSRVPRFCPITAICNTNFGLF